MRQIRIPSLAKLFVFLLRKELTNLQGLGLLEHVDGIHKASRHRLAGNDQGLGARPTVEEADAVHEFAGGNAGRGKQHRFARCQFVGIVNFVRVSNVHFFQSGNVGFFAFANQAGFDDGGAGS